MQQDVVTAVHTDGPTGPAPVLVVCEHASNHFPAHFGTLGLDAEARMSHAAWDPGALDQARRLAQALNAPLVHGGVSRLIYDCNRPPEAPGAITAQSERFAVPGNQNLTPSERQARVDLVYTPFSKAVGNAIVTARPHALITMHSFTPVYHGTKRDVEIGILHDTDTRLADALLAALADAPYQVARNAPYGPEDGVTHTLREHALPGQLLNVMIELRSDLLENETGRERIAAILLKGLQSALSACAPTLEGKV